MNSTTILKGNILYTPRPSEFIAIQQGYIIAVDGVVVHCGESIPPAYGEHARLLIMVIISSFQVLWIRMLMHRSIAIVVLVWTKNSYLG